MSKIQASARVQLTVEVTADGVWGEDCPLSQIHKQAVESAKAKLHQAITRSPGCNAFIIGEQKILTVSVEKS